MIQVLFTTYMCVSKTTKNLTIILEQKQRTTIQNESMCFIHTRTCVYMMDTDKSNFVYYNIPSALQGRKKKKKSPAWNHFFLARIAAELDPNTPTAAAAHTDRR